MSSSQKQNAESNGSTDVCFVGSIGEVPEAISVDSMGYVSKYLVTAALQIHSPNMELVREIPVKGEKRTLLSLCRVDQTILTHSCTSIFQKLGLYGMVVEKQHHLDAFHSHEAKTCSIDFESPFEHAMNSSFIVTLPIEDCTEVTVRDHELNALRVLPSFNHFKSKPAAFIDDLNVLTIVYQRIGGGGNAHLVQYDLSTGRHIFENTVFIFRPTETSFTRFRLSATSKSIFTVGEDYFSFLLYIIVMNSHGECGKTTYFNKHFRCLNMRKDVLLMKRDNHVDFHPYVVFMQSMRAYRVGVTFPNGVQFTPQDSMLDENSENIVFFDRKNVWKIPLAEKNLTLVDDVFVL
jgi:hypothetical protein